MSINENRPMRTYYILRYYGKQRILYNVNNIIYIRI